MLLHKSDQLLHVSTVSCVWLALYSWHCALVHGYNAVVMCVCAILSTSVSASYVLACLTLAKAETHSGRVLQSCRQCLKCQAWMQIWLGWDVIWTLSLIKRGFLSCNAISLDERQLGQDNWDEMREMKGFGVMGQSNVMRALQQMHPVKGQQRVLLICALYMFLAVLQKLGSCVHAVCSDLEGQKCFC